MRAVRAGKLPIVMRQPLCHPVARELASALRGRLRGIWRAPPVLTTENAYFWPDLLASTSLVSLASGAQWRQLYQQPYEILFAPPAIREMSRRTTSSQSPTMRGRGPLAGGSGEARRAEGAGEAEEITWSARSRFSATVKAGMPAG